MSNSFKLVAIFLVLCASCTWGLNLGFKSHTNISASVTDNGWQYRRTTLRGWRVITADGLFAGANFVSVGIVKNKGSGQVDILTGSIYVNGGMHPFAFMGYFDSELKWNVSVDTDSQYAMTTNYQAAKGYVGVSYIGLLEVDPSGVVVAAHSLSEAPLFPSPANGLQWSATNASVVGNVKYVTLTGKPEASASWSISLTYVLSSVAGVLEESDAVIVPKSLESFVEITNWPYKSSSNSLTLVMGVGTGAATRSVSGQSLLSGSTSDDSQVYFTLSKNVLVGGTKKNVDIAMETNATVNINNSDYYFYQQLVSVYGGSASYHIVNVTFPAGAADIVYDPSQGAGELVEGVSESNAAFRSHVASFVLLAFVVFGLLL